VNMDVVVLNTESIEEEKCIIMDGSQCSSLRRWRLVWRNETVYLVF